MQKCLHFMKKEKGKTFDSDNSCKKLEKMKMKSLEISLSLSCLRETDSTVDTTQKGFRLIKKYYAFGMRPSEIWFIINNKFDKSLVLKTSAS